MHLTTKSGIWYNAITVISKYQNFGLTSTIQNVQTFTEQR